MTNQTHERMGVGDKFDVGWGDGWNYGVAASEGCCNKAPHPGFFKRVETDRLTVLEAGSSKSQGLPGCAFSETRGRERPCSPRPGCSHLSWHSMAYSRATSISAVVTSDRGVLPVSFSIFISTQVPWD